MRFEYRRPDGGIYVPWAADVGRGRKKDFYNAFGKSLEDVYGEIIEKLCAQGLLTDGDSVRLTPYGRDISNYVMAEFLQ